MKKGNFKRKLKQFFEKVREFFKELNSDLDEFFENTVRPTVQFLEVIKLSLNNPAINILTVFIPGEIDDKIIRKLREILPKIIIKLGIVINIQEHFSPEKTIDLYCKELNNLPLELKNAALHIAYNQLKEENTNKNGI